MLIKNDEVISIIKGKKVEVESITIDKENASIEIGSTLQLNATITPSNATDKTITWTSSDDKVATVDSNGLVIGLKVGNVTITVTTSNGKKATANITIRDYLSNVANVGDYVAYDAGTWAETKDKPTTQGQFGGYTKGENKANNASWCYGYESARSRGWRVLSVDKNTNTVTIIHAGQPECYYHDTDSSASVIALNNRATSEYLNNSYADSTHMMNYEEANAIAQSNDLRTTGARYWLASSGDSNNVWGVYVDGFVGIDNANGYSFGVRPVVVLKSNIKTTGKTTDVVGQDAWSLVLPN